MSGGGDGRAPAAAGDTIVAVATPGGAAPRAALRLSGPRARDLVEATCRERGGGSLVLGARGARPVTFDDGAGTVPALVLWFPGPRSFTREDVAELHLPGAPPLIEAALARLLALGARGAEPGEFTRRAFENGRIDLTRAEGVLTLVASHSREERRAALALLDGGLARRMGTLRASLDAVRALCEASLDFDEADTVDVPRAEVAAGIAEARDLLAEALTWEERREPLGRAPRVVLAGRPNAGKSALFNALVARAGDPAATTRAIVADHTGTTRDVREAELQVGGRAVTLVDTAGVEDAAGPASRGAQRQTERARDLADLELWVVDAARPEDAPASSERLVVWNKTDRADASPPPVGARAVSAEGGDGLERLLAAIDAALASGRRASADARALGARHRAALAAAAEELDASAAALDGGLPLDLVAESLRAATAALDGIVGRTTAEDLLDRIFAQFCLGK